MSIESILRRKGTDVTTIGPEASIKSAADWLRAKNIGALVVTSGNAVLGLISEREIVHETIGSIGVRGVPGALTSFAGTLRTSTRGRKKRRTARNSKTVAGGRSK